MPSDDPLYREKRARLAEQDLSTQQTFQLSSSEPLPAALLPYLRLVFASTMEELWAVDFGPEAKPISAANEAQVLSQLMHQLRRRLAAYKTTIAEDTAIIEDPTTGPRQTVAARLLRIEKGILQGALGEVLKRPGATETSSPGDAQGVKFF